MVTGRAGGRRRSGHGPISAIGAVNSFKRINHEAAGKARAWLTRFGSLQIVPCAIIDGVFNPANLEVAQGEGLMIVWSHRLSDLTEFIEETRNPS